MAQAADPDTVLKPPLKVIHVGRDLTADRRYGMVNLARKELNYLAVARDFSIYCSVSQPRCVLIFHNGFKMSLIMLSSYLSVCVLHVICHKLIILVNLMAFLSSNLL